MALDGQPGRGSQQQGAPGGPRLAALAHRVGVTLAQQAVDDKTNEMPVAVEGLRHRGREGRSVTREAGLTQRPMAQQIGDAGGAYVRGGTETQPQ